MIKNSSIIALCLFGLFVSQQAIAGNPDRQGEAGAYELLLNPWARSIGLNGLVAARATGAEALYFNPAGLGRVRGTDVLLSHTRYMAGTGLGISALGLGQGIGESGTIGVSLMSLSFGDIPLTTTNQPEGVGTFKPTFFNLGVSYGHVFRDKDTKREKVTVGATVRVVSEAIANANATAIAFDAGIQYAAGKDNQLKFGIALRNIGTKMRFRGEGLSYVGIAPNQSTPITVQQRTAGFDLPSLLNLGLSYDFLFEKDSAGVAGQRLTVVGQFTANSYSRDQYGVGFEYAFKEMFMARMGYRYEIGMYDATGSATVSTGLAAGASIQIPFKKGSQRKIAFDYGFEYTRVFNGTHSFGLKLTL